MVLSRFVFFNGKMEAYLSYCFGCCAHKQSNIKNRRLKLMSMLDTGLLCPLERYKKLSTVCRRKLNGAAITIIDPSLSL